LYWANKRLAYRQTPLADVLDEIGVIFDKEIVYDRESIDSCKITGLFRDQNFEEIIENIALSFPINYTMTGDRVEITSNGCSN
jgi:ferric-dicitrate binding protein FerR (iron transport regulator)